MRADLPTLAMRASLLVAVLMLVGKLTAYLITGSTAILSDAAESVVHILATAIAAMSLWYARQPADRQHPYGHGKIAHFSAGFEGALILTAALYIVFEGVQALIVGPELRSLDVGLAITAALALINLALGLTLVHVGRTHNLLVLVANGQHVLTDMWTSIAVVIGVGIVWFTGILWLDPAIAIAAGLNIMWTAIGLIRRALAGLFDAADPESTRRILECLDRAKAEGLIADYHQLRHRAADALRWVEVHMLVDGAMSIDEAHRRVTQVEESINALFPGTVHLTTHIEPAAHDQHHPGGHPELPDPLDSGR
jgi:cation diffusion facilitator family transporter